MPFTDNLFIFFISVFYLIYFWLEKISTITALRFTAIASLLFVAFYFPLFAIIPLIQTFVIVWFSRKERNIIALWVALVVLLLPLLIFKYTDFVLSSLGKETAGFVLPLGISFYTFTAIGLIVDHYRKPGAFIGLNFSKALNFVTFWPHLASGPILRGENFINKDVIPFGKRDFSTALILIIYGLFKKLVIANGAAGYVNQNISLGIDGMSSIEAISTLIGYSVRIYGDFSGYSDMAIGFAMLMGINIPANFNFPYLAVSLTDFWRRWHISLSSWFRDYVYIPLGGNKLKNIKSILIIMLVFTLSGLWHGAAWNYVVWGGLHGGGLCLERELRKRVNVPVILSRIFTIIFVTLTWSFFFLSFDNAMTLLKAVFVFEHTQTPYNVLPLLFYALLVFLDHTFKPYKENNGRIESTRMAKLIIPLLLFSCMFFSGKSQPFIYFDF